MSVMPSTNRRIRKSFGKIKEIIEIPDLIGMQRESYRRFLQIDIPPEKRKDIGLQAVFKSVFPIKDFTGSASLEFVSYRFGEVKHSVEECIHRGMTYELPVRITVRLVVFDVGKETIAAYTETISRAKTLFVNGPPGVYENEISATGTEKLWKAVQEAGGFTVAGGGDTVTSFTKFADITKLDYVSTAGGALIRYLSGVKLPLLEAMSKPVKGQFT